MLYDDKLYCELCKIKYTPSCKIVSQHVLEICCECSEQYCYQQLHKCKKDYDKCEFCDLSFAHENDFESHNHNMLYVHLNIMFKQIKKNQDDLKNIKEIHYSSPN
jgi:hypothetical protein